MSRLKDVTDAINRALQRRFYRLGITVGTYPWQTILITTIIFGLCMIGIIRFTRESRPEKLWVPTNADITDDKDWVERNFPAKFVPIFYLAVRAPSGGDAGVLEAATVKQLLQMHMEVIDIEANNGTATFNWSQIAYPRKGNNYWASSILALWEFNSTQINALTTADILHKVNEPNLQDPWNGGKFAISSILGEIQINSDGAITGAKAVTGTYRLYTNETWDSGEGRPVTKRADDFSKKYEAIVRSGKWKQFAEMTVFTQKGSREESSRAISGDVSILSAGYFFILLYVILNLGRYNRLHHRAWLSLSGIISTGMAIGISFSLSSSFGFFYGPVHSVLPFLLLGIGVDDMFVIVQAWDNLADENEENKRKTIPEQLGLCMMNAGASVTVTSITDLAAFLIGATTVLPALRSFCFYAGIGVFADFFTQITFFAATLALDAKRVAANRDACFPCITLPKQWKPWNIKGRWLSHYFQKYHTPLVQNLPFKIAVLIATASLASVGIYSATQIDSHFDFDWFFPDGSYILRYRKLSKQYFPAGERRCTVYLGDVNYSSPQVQTKLHELVDTFAANQFVRNTTVDAWIDGMENWAEGQSLVGDRNFYTALPQFLKDPVYAHYGKSFSYTNRPRGPANDSLKATRFDGLLIHLPHTRDKTRALDSLRSTASSVTFPDGQRAFAYMFQFLPWTTNKIIDEELRRNLILAMVAVFLVAVFIIADLLSAFYVLICVMLTVVDTIMVMYYWDLTINTVTTIILILSVGLAVDYSAHVAHEFMVAQGSRRERVAAALKRIGVAVFNGGFSTFLAFILLSAGNSYIFRTFFKVFLAVVIFGLFHGLIFLPVILSLIGPPSHSPMEMMRIGPSLSDGDASSGEAADRTATMGTSNGDAIAMSELEPNLREEV